MPNSLFSLGHHPFLDTAKNRVSDGRFIVGFRLQVTDRHLRDRPVFQLHPVLSRWFMTGVVGLIPSPRDFRRRIITMLAWGPVVHRLEGDACARRFTDVLPEEGEDREAAADEAASYFGIAMHTRLGPESDRMHEMLIPASYPKRPVSICT